MKPIQNAADAAARVHEALATDDRTGGEGHWYFAVQGDRSTIAAFPPPGTHRNTLGDIIERARGGHVGLGEIDPENPGDARRAILFDCVYQEPGACDEAAGVHPGPRRTADDAEADGLQPSTAPTGTGKPGDPPPPAQGDG